MFNRNLHVALLHEPLELFSPLDEQDALRGHQIVKGQRVELALRVNTIKIDMKERDLGAAVFVDKSERGTGDIFSFSCLEAFSNTFDHGGLSRSQIAAQEHDAARLEISGQAAAELRSLCGGVRGKGIHRWR